MRIFSSLIGGLLLSATMAQPCANFQACFVTSGAGPSSTFFNNCTPNDGGTQFIWSFGDGTESTLVAPTHEFAASGQYEVCLTAYWQDCVDSTCAMVLVTGGDPCAGLEACFEPSQLSETVFFFSNCSSPSLFSSFVWDFGDGTTSTSFSPIHTYAEVGVYLVCLIGTWPEGCTAEWCSELVVGEDPCNGLEACFVVNELQQAGAFFFDNCSQGPLNNQFIWDFGDGGSSTGTNVDHFYIAPGTYSVCLTVFSQNCSDSTCTTITVGSANPCDALDAGFSSSSAGLGVNFANDVFNNQWTYLWYFGDDTEGDGPNPYHAYAETGSYQVCSVVYTWDSVAQDTCFADHCAWITVTDDDPCSDLQACFVTNDFGNSTFFFDNCTGGPTGTPFSWDFGDGTTSTVTNVEHHFMAPGTYTVCLFAYWQNCSDSTCTTITIPMVDACDGFIAGFDHASTPNGTFFLNTTTSVGFETQFFWDFGDGSTSADAQPLHLYAQDGIYEVCLTATSFLKISPEGALSCVDTTCALITTGIVDPCEMLVACFESLPFENGVYFFQNCTQELPIGASANYFWDFGDGSTSNAMQTDHAFAPGTYTVCLTVEQGNCVDSTCTTFTVGGGFGCNPDFACTFTYDAQGTVVVFFGTANSVLDGVVWDFGDGTEGYTTTITHLYEPPGPYEVCLNAWYWNEAEQDTCWTEHCALVDPFTVGFADATNSSIGFFPIPAHDAIQVTGLPANTQLRLFAMDGRLVRTERTSSSVHQITVVDLAPATYVLRVDVDGQALYRKVVVE